MIRAVLDRGMMVCCVRAVAMLPCGLLVAFARRLCVLEPVVEGRSCFCLKVVGPGFAGGQVVIEVV